MNSQLSWSWLGTQPYEQTRLQQVEYRREVIDRHQPETIWLLEHLPVITTGRRPVPDLPSASALQEQGIALHQSERGGLATYHGPGQLIAYAIVDAGTRKIGVRGTICAMEAGVIALLSTLGICAHRRPGYPGVWVGKDKICAVGMHFRRGVSMHGIALNLDPDLRGFDLIVPCGIKDGSITSVAKLLGSAPSPQDVAPILGPILVRKLDERTANVRQDCATRLTSGEPEDSSAPLPGT